MSVNNPDEVFDRYAQPIQVALHCVTPAKLKRGAARPEITQLLTTADEPTIELKRRNPESSQRLDSVYLFVSQYYRIIPVAQAGVSRSYRVSTVGYSYEIRNSLQQEIVAFHWHPGQRSHEDEPHIHVGSAILDSKSSDLGKVFSTFHIPTGPISLAQVVRLLLRDFNVVPNRRDWEETLRWVRSALQ